MSKKISQEQTVLVSSETHGMIIEQYCPFARYVTGMGLNRKDLVNLMRRKAVVYKGEIKKVICEDFDLETRKCMRDRNDLKDKRCFFMT